MGYRILGLLFGLFFTLNAQAIPGNGAPVAIVGVTPTATAGLAIIDISCILSGACFGIDAGPGVTRTADHVMPFRKNGALYQVTSGKTAYCLAITLWAATASDKFQLMSDTATFANDAIIGSLTAPVYQNGVSANYGMITHATTSSIPDPYPGIYAFTSLTWPGVQQATTDTYNVTAICREN